ncbi:MAG TPA: hypothetical protein VHY91_06610 [Pirellulales bacterium]|nr:hypothetical protein [Pirellulales bacterium]
MFANRKWLRFCVVAAFVLTPIWVMLEEGASMAVVSIVSTLLVLLCAAGAVYTARDSQSDADAALPLDPPEF